MYYVTVTKIIISSGNVACKNKGLHKMLGEQWMSNPKKTSNNDSFCFSCIHCSHKITRYELLWRTAVEVRNMFCIHFIWWNTNYSWPFLNLIFFPYVKFHLNVTILKASGLGIFGIFRYLNCRKNKSHNVGWM